MSYQDAYSIPHQDATTIDALSANGDLFRAIFDSSPDALFLSADDDASRILECNDRAVELFEASSKAALIGNFGGAQRVVPLTAEDLRQRSLELQEKGSVYSEVEYRSFTGRTFWTAHLVKRVTVGKQTLRFTRITDIDKRKAIENDLLRHKEMLEEAQRIANIGSWEFDLATQKISWSEETFRLFGMEPEAAAPSFEEYLNMMSAEHQKHVRTMIAKAIRHERFYRIEARIVGRDGVVRYHEASGKVVQNQAGEAVKLIGTVRDITERHLQSLALQESEMRLRSIVDNTNAMIASLALDGTITFVSNSIQKSLGFVAEDVIGQHFGRLLHSNHHASIAELARKGLADEIRDASVDVRLRHQNDSWIWFNVIATLVRDSNNEPSHFITIASNIEAQKQMQEKLRRSEESLAEAQRMSHLGSWYADVQTENIEWSDELYRIFGLPLSTKPFNAQEFLAVVHPDDKKAAKDGLKRAIYHHEMIQEEIRIMRGTRVRWLDTRIKPVIDSNGKTIALFGTVWDITERKITDSQIRALNLTLEERVQERTQQLEEANKQLRTSQTSLKTLIESTSDAIWSIDRAYRLTAMNAACYSLLTIHNHYTEPKLGDTVLRLIPGAQPNEWQRLYDRVLLGERFATLLHYRLTGIYFDVEVSFNPIIDEQGSIVGAVIYSRDITERLQTERELREREQFLQLIFDTVPVGLLLTDRMGNYRRVNAEFSRVSGYSASELEGKSIRDILPEEITDAAMEVYQGLFEKAALHNQGEAAILQKNGSKIPVDFATSLFTTTLGEVLAITTITDIAPRKQAEEEVKRALEQERELSALKSRFVVMVSHEFRTPLTTIRASAQLMERLRDRLSPEKQREYLHDIQQSVDTMSHLMEDVLYLGKADAQGLTCTPTPTNLATLCENIINGFEVLPEYEHRILAQIIGALPQFLLLDEKLLRHILTNLLSNALKYSPQEQTIDFHIQYLPSNAEGEEGTNPDVIRFSVKDNGIGIADEDLRHLFEPFYRATNVGNISGTGLGLAIVKQAVDAHHGIITCDSTIGHGTEFIVVIPSSVS